MRIALSLFFALSVVSNAGTFEEALDAYRAQDFHRAEQLFRKSAGQGNAQAAAYLGRLYENGQGVPRDPAEAARWYLSAAEAGHRGAQTILGVMYVNGNGVPKDVKQAAAWFSKAADQGDPAAKRFLTQLSAESHSAPQAISDRDAAINRIRHRSADLIAHLIYVVAALAGIIKFLRRRRGDAVVGAAVSRLPAAEALHLRRFSFQNGREVIDDQARLVFRLESQRDPKKEIAGLLIGAAAAAATAAVASTPLWIMAFADLATRRRLIGLLPRGFWAADLFAGIAGAVIVFIAVAYLLQPKRRLILTSTETPAETILRVEQDLRSLASSRYSILLADGRLLARISANPLVSAFLGAWSVALPDGSLCLTVKETERWRLALRIILALFFLPLVLFFKLRGDFEIESAGSKAVVGRIANTAVGWRLELADDPTASFDPRTALAFAALLSAR